MADFCKRCGRALKSRTSIQRGYGPHCYEKVHGDKKESKELIEDQIIEEPIAGQIFIDELEENRKIS